MRSIPLAIFLAILSGPAARAQQAAQPPEPGSPPALTFETLPAADGSLWECAVFTTVPGLLHCVQESHDLVNWATRDSFYGMGHQFVTPLRRVVAPPPPGSGGALPPSCQAATTVSLRLDHSSAPTGGTIVSWLSLDDHTPRQYLIPGTLDVRWSECPFFAERYGNYYFFIAHPPGAVPPPPSNPQIASLDSAMVAVLEASLDDMNQRIAASVAASRNAPPPVPPDPSSRLFLRMGADWSLDSDGDGSPDWMEWRMAADAGAFPPDAGGLRADAFNADTNGDGKPDGDALDQDQDGVPDAIDTDSGGPGNAQDANLVKWSRPPGFRFAAFTLPVPQPTEEQILEYQDMSAAGTVLFEWVPAFGDEDWWFTRSIVVDRKLHAHTCENGEGARIELGIFVNTNETLFGESLAGDLTVTNPDTGGLTAEPSLWDPMASTYTPYGWWWENSFFCDIRGSFRVLKSFIGEGVGDFTTPFGDLPGGDENIWWGPGSPWIEGNGNIVCDRFYWRFNSTNSTYSPAVALPEESVIRSATLVRPDPDQPGVLMPPVNLVAGTTSLLIGAGNGGIARSKVTLKPGQKAVGVTSYGWFASDREIWNHDHWMPLVDMLAGSGISSATLFDISDNGRALANLVSSNGAKSICMLMPLVVSGVDVSTGAMDTESGVAGVDNLSCEALHGGGKTPRVWIMAPLESSNSVRIRGPFNPVQSLDFQGTDGKVDIMLPTLSAEDQIVRFIGLGTATVECLPVLKLSGTTAASTQPIGIYSMKRRTVKVALHKVVGRNAAGAKSEPKWFPDAASLETGLNAIYGPQCNTFYSVTTFTEDGPDHNGIDIEGVTGGNRDGKLLIGTGSEPEVVAATPNAKATGQPGETANIDIWVTGGLTLMLGREPAYGAQIGGENVGKILIDGDLLNNPVDATTAPDAFGHVAAHEIGHVFCGHGHVDTGDGKQCLFWGRYPPSNARPSRHPRDQERLMCSGGGMDFNKPGKRLIYREWVKVEAWLKKKEEALGYSL